MDIENRIQILVQNLKSSRKNTTVSVAAASLLTVLIFLGACTFMLLSYVEKLHDHYYGAMLRDVSSFQRTLIGGKSYREDMKELARALQLHRGVIHVWFTDRYGKLIYHTDDVVLDEYGARRLPSQYFESIERTWEFDGPYPVMHKVLLDNRLNQRLSQPLFINSPENYDFIVGLDVQRFLLIPHRVYPVLLFASAFVAVAFLLFFLPVFFLIRWRLREAESQARMIRLQGIPPASSGLPIDDVGSELPPSFKAESRAETLTEAQVEARPEQPSPVAEAAADLKALKEKPTPQTTPASKVMSEEIEQDKLYITFLKQKRTLFADHVVELQFLQVHSCSLHSKGAEGSYVLYRQLGKKHLLACFTAPEGEAPGIYGVIVDLAERIRDSLKADSTTAKLIRGYNSYSRREKKSFEISLLLIDEGKQSVEYTCTGTKTALYLKDGENEAKELRLENPGLGSLPSKEFGQALSSADIKLATNDLFLLPAHNASSVSIGEATLESLLEIELVERRKLSASEIGGGILKQFESLDLTVKNALPQSGYVVVKFL